MIKAAFFDLDGTLIDSEKIYIDCWMRAGVACGFPFDRDFALGLRSLYSKLASEKFMDRFGDEDAYRLVKEKRKEYMNEYAKDHAFEPKPGVKEVVSLLKSRGISAYVVTASPVERARKHMISAGMSEYFDTIISAADVERGKPYPDVYLEAARQAGVAPGESIAFEDSPNGLISAHTAGCITIMIPDQTDLTDDLRKYVDYRFATLLEVDLEPIENKI